MHIIGIRKEDKNQWERRVPIVPEQVRQLLEEYEIRSHIQCSQIRAIPEDDFTTAGAEITADIPDTPVIFAVKEIPLEQLREGRTYVFFSHVVKGQEYNMPLLRRLMELHCSLIDYEKITDEKGRRLVFFGKEAGQAGMIDTLWALGRRLDYEGIHTPLSDIRKTVEYQGLDDAIHHLRSIGDRIRQEGLPPEICPLVVGFAGYGNVSRGAQEVLETLPFMEIEPGEVATFKERDHSRKLLYKVVFKEEHMAVLSEGNSAGNEEASDQGGLVNEEGDPAPPFDLQDYYDNPEKYHGIFEQYVPHLTVLMNCIYWEERYPRLVTKEQVREIYSGAEHPVFRVVGDISCDYEGSIEATIHSTDSGHPTFIYDPFSDTIIEHGQGRGLTIMAVDNLPAELPREASNRFSRSLYPFIPSIARTDFSVAFQELGLMPEIKRALILHRGILTPDYQYLRTYVDRVKNEHKLVDNKNTIRREEVDNYQ